MSHAYWFKAPLTCLHCGAVLPPECVHLLVSGLNPESRDEVVWIGTSLAICAGDFDDAFIRIHRPPEGQDITCLEQWGCLRCKHAQWARLRFAHEAYAAYRFCECTNVPLTLEIVRDLHYITTHIETWSAPDPETDRIHEFLGPLLHR